MSFMCITGRRMSRPGGLNKPAAGAQQHHTHENVIYLGSIGRSRQMVHQRTSDMNEGGLQAAAVGQDMRIQDVIVWYTKQRAL